MPISNKKNKHTLKKTALGVTLAAGLGLAAKHKYDNFKSKNFTFTLSGDVTGLVPTSPLLKHINDPKLTNYQKKEINKATKEVVSSLNSAQLLYRGKSIHELFVDLLAIHGIETRHKLGFLKQALPLLVKNVLAEFVLRDRGKYIYVEFELKKIILQNTDGIPHLIRELEKLMTTLNQEIENHKADEGKTWNQKMFSSIASSGNKLKKRLSRRVSREAEKD